jgi:hypothetical protein
LIGARVAVGERLRIVFEFENLPGDFATFVSRKFRELGNNLSGAHTGNLNVRAARAMELSHLVLKV